MPDFASSTSSLNEIPTFPAQSRDIGTKPGILVHRSEVTVMNVRPHRLALDAVLWVSAVAIAGLVGLTSGALHGL